MYNGKSVVINLINDGCYFCNDLGLFMSIELFGRLGKSICFRKCV